MNVRSTIRADREQQGDAAPESVFYDLIILGAGLSGLGAAHYFKKSFPEKTFAILDANSSYGGTWFTHRYPGVRSDSDLFNFGYKFKPWGGPPIASGAEILRYLGDLIAEDKMEPHINYGVRLLKADWSEERKHWTLAAEEVATGLTRVFETPFLWMCHGYYDHSRGYIPDWPGLSDFKGEVIHPQNWPDNTDLTGKRVVVIGSGATAATLVPALTEQAAHVTMLQRSPTYFLPRPNRSDLADKLRALKVDPHWIHEIVRREMSEAGNALTRMLLDNPKESREMLLGTLRELIGSEMVDKHFSPSYDPWRQRVALIPDGDFFEVVNSGKASVVTDHIERFTPEGILLKSGQLLDADIVVSATGFNMNVMADVAFSIDGEPIDFTSTVTWRGMMFTKVPNFIWIFGYYRSAWTLRVDLVGEFTVRLLRYMYDNHLSSVRPVLPLSVTDADLGPFLDTTDFNPGYLLRKVDLLPKSGPTDEWRHTQDYWRERVEFPELSVNPSELDWR